MPITLNKSWRSRPSIGAAKRMDWVLREVRCIAKPGAERETLERLVQQEIDRMRALGKSAETIWEFRLARAEVLFEVPAERRTRSPLGARTSGHGGKGRARR
jgi:hypothetical protein